MDCRFFKDKMGAYLEGELPAGDLSAFKGHLETCPQCRKDLEDLEKTRAYLGALEEVEPPAWFEQKVMAGVREAHEKKSVWRRLFYPLHVKVPVQALATIIVVVFAVHVFKDMEPQMKSVQAPPAPAGEPAQKRDAAPPPVSPEKKPAAPAVKAPAVPAKGPAMVADAPRQAVQAQKDAVSQSVSREYKAAAKPDLPAAVPPLAPAEDSLRGEAAAPPPAVMSSPASPPARLKERSMAVGKRPEKKESEVPASLDYAPAAAKGKSSVAEYARRPASQVSLKIRPRDAGSAPEKIKLLLGEFGAVNISASADKISAELPADRWSGFATGLTQIGEIKGFPSLPPAAGSVRIAISIETDPGPSDAR